MNTHALPQQHAPIAIAVDIGGTKIRSAAIDRDGNLLADARHAAEANRGAQHVLDVIAAGIEEIKVNLGTRVSEVAGLGISTAGVVEPASGRILSAADQIPGWKGQSLGAHFTQKFAWPVVADNDANCALAGELWHGKHQIDSSATVLMFTLGTGLGGAMSVNGRVLTGRHHLTGHFGIARMTDPYTKRDVKVEELVSGTGLGNIYRQFVASATTATGHDVIAGVQAGSAQAKAALERWCEHLARQIHNYHWMIDPDLFIIGGGLVDAREVWWPTLTKMLAANGLNAVLAPATLGNDAGVYGAAKLVFDSANMSKR